MTVQRSPVSWPGGKAKLAQTILKHAPEHRLYVEPFGGGAGVLLNKPISPKEVYNDIDGSVVGFFRCVRFHKDEFIREIELVPNSRQEFNDFLTQRGLTDIQRAARWYLCNKLSFGGLGSHFGTGRKSGGGAFSSRANRIELLEQVNQRFDSVVIEHLPAIECIRLYDIDDAFFFVDPPYMNGYAYGQLFSKDDHREIRDVLFAAKGKWLVTYDDHPFIRELYRGCKIVEISGQLGIGNNQRSKRPQLKQLLIAPKGQR